MSDTDTSAEAVERLADAIEEGARAFGGAADAITRHDMVAAFRGQEVHQRNLAATLRALLAERDALATSCGHCGNLEVAWAERDAARAEAARLGEAAENVVIARGMGWDMDGVLNVLEAALAAKKPGHE